MDIICPRCGEPWDTDEFHDLPELSYAKAIRRFYSVGCGVLFNNRPCQQVETEATAASRVLYEVLGDDVDGISAELADLGYL